jgi:hypothetical protein
MAKFWVGEVKTTDDYGRLIGERFVDGRTEHGFWAIMSMTSYDLHGVGLGEGKGQMYRKTDDGWRMQEGSEVSPWQKG